MQFSYIKTDQAPEALGPYSQAVKAGNLLFLSGQIGTDPNTGNLVSEGLEAQTWQALKNLQAVLTAAGLDFTYVADVMIFITNMQDFSKVNTIYAEVMGQNRPARATVAVSQLPKNAKIEIKMTAILE